MNKKSFITGISGQDGSYLAEFLLAEGYEVFGLVRRQSNEKLDNIKQIIDKVKLIYGDLTDQTSLVNALNIAKPDMVFNCGAQSFVKTSWEQPEFTANVTGIGALRMLEAIRQTNKNVKFITCSSSEQYGDVLEVPQTEKTPFNPVSPYAVSKTFAHYITRTYRFSYNMFASTAISFNHESSRRGVEFVTRKISQGVARIYYELRYSDKTQKIILGNLDASRDWSHAKDIVKGIYAIMQHNEPDDFVLCSGETHSIREFLTEAFKVIGIDDWTSYVEIDQKFMRPAEVNLLKGNYTKAKTLLGWQPEIGFKDLVREMVENDIKLLNGS